MWFVVHMFVFKSGQCELFKINKEENKMLPLKISLKVVNNGKQS